MWVLIFMKLSSWDGHLEQRIEVARFKDRGYCEQAAEPIRKTAYEGDYFVCADEMPAPPIVKGKP